MTAQKTLYNDHVSKLFLFYDKLLHEHNYSGIVIPSGIPKQKFLDDNYYPFIVNVHFKALLPVIDAPHSYIVYLSGKKPQLIFYQPKDYWHVVPANPKGDWVEHFDIIITTDRDLWQSLLPANKAQFVWLGEHQQELKGLNIGNINPPALLNAIHYNRAIKTKYEIDCLREANHKAAKGHLAAKEAFYGGGSELEIHLAYLNASKQTEEQLPYNNIVALNEHGSVLHYNDLKTINFDQSNLHSFLIDAGSTHNGYISDITRTWSYQDDEFNDLIQQFDLLQQQIIKKMKAGINYVDLHIRAHLEISALLKKNGFIYCDAETAVDTGISNTFFAHGLGHLLGLQVHDIGGHQINAQGDIAAPPENFPALRLTRTLETGYCVTIEPGLYFIDILLEKLAASNHASLINWGKVEIFKKYGGIRIEDDVVITDNGYENLTRDAFTALSNDD